MMSIRKSSRVRSLSLKAKEAQQQQIPAQTNSAETPITNKRKSASERDVVPPKKRKVADDVIDPVERLLSLNSTNNDILMDLQYENSADEEEWEYEDEDESMIHEYNQISLNFSKILNDNLVKYYSSFKKSPLEIYNANSSFSILNQKDSANDLPAASVQTPNPSAPFFKSVNFNPQPKTHMFDEYLSLNDDAKLDTDENQTDDSEALPSPLLENKKMCFHYRHNDNLNLSLNNKQHNEFDLSKILNPRSIMSGKASEMIGSGNFLINDFFL